MRRKLNSTKQTKQIWKVRGLSDTPNRNYFQPQREQVEKTKISRSCYLFFSKLNLCRLHYVEVKSLYDENARIMYRGSDSLFYKNDLDDIYEALVHLKHTIDLFD